MLTLCRYFLVVEFFTVEVYPDSHPAAADPESPIGRDPADPESPIGQDLELWDPDRPEYPRNNPGHPLRFPLPLLPRSYTHAQCIVPSAGCP